MLPASHTSYEVALRTLLRRTEALAEQSAPPSLQASLQIRLGLNIERSSALKEEKNIIEAISDTIANAIGDEKFTLPLAVWQTSNSQSAEINAAYIEEINESIKNYSKHRIFRFVFGIGL